MDDIIVHKSIVHEKLGFSVTPILYKGEPVIMPKEIEAVLEYEDINNSIKYLINKNELEEGFDILTLKGKELIDFKMVLKSVQNDEPPETFMGINVEMSDSSTIAHLLPSKSNSLRLLYEPGLYTLVLKSRAAGAREFRKWIAREVLPSIRRTGKYEVPTDEQKAARISLITDAFSIFASKFKIPQHLAQAEACKAIRKEFDVDLTEMVNRSPAAQNIQEEEKELEPTELAKVFGCRSGQQMNILLARLGLQVKIRGTWTPTPEGEKISSAHSWVKQNKSGYNLKWNVEAVRALLKTIPTSRIK